MNPRPIFLLATLALVLLPAAPAAAKGELMFGCWTRPACGKVCKLVCETTTLTSTCYGAECDQLCVPSPSCPGCKHCAACCGTCEPGLACLPKCLFCWRDWCPTGCATPISVKKLVKYEAEREVCWYHWEVVDACRCGCGCGDGCVPDGEPGCGCGCVYKPAPADAKIGTSLGLSDEEQAQLATWKASRGQQNAVQPASAVTTSADADDATASGAADNSADDQAAQPLWRKLSGMFHHPADQP